MHNVYVCIITEASRGVKEIRLFISSLLLFFCFFLLYNSIYNIHRSDQEIDTALFQNGAF